VPEHQEDEDDEDFYSQTAYNEHYYIEKELEEIKEITAEFDDKEMRDQEELEEHLLSLSPIEYIEWKRKHRNQDGKYSFGSQEAIINVNKVRYPHVTDGGQIRAIEEQIMSEEEESENFARLMDTMNNISIRRPVSSETHSVRLYEDNCDQLQKLCESTG